MNNGTIKKHSVSTTVYVQNLDWGTITDTFEYTIKEVC